VFVCGKDKENCRGLPAVFLFVDSGRFSFPEKFAIILHINKFG
jgi:hypothetical protein